jgi:2-octaprenyl-6-methoxyphenol hydroxylase
MDKVDKAATESLDTDILILGAGPVGMTLALALADSGQRVRLLDRRPRGAWADDPRGLALSHGCRQLLERLDAWNASAGTPIRDIHVSQRGGFGRTMIEAADYGTPALGYVMRYRDLAAALDARIPAAQWLEPGQVVTITTNDSGALATVTRGDVTRQITARLVVHGEGTPQNDPDVSVSDYGQHAVIAVVRPAAPHGNRAWERFTPDGPLALLPIGDDYSVVFTVPPEKAECILALDDAGFLAALRAQFGTRLDFVRTGPRAAYPLALRVRRHLTQPRQVWIGNAAQTLHPVSGQGFNLGLRDAWELAEKLLDGLEQQPDAGHPAALAAYARGRQTDRRGSMAFTDGIVRLFSNDLPPLKLARGLGLLALDLVPPLRHFVAKRMIWGARAW